jgi:hypothetical protein
MTHTHYIPFVAAASTELYSASEGGREGGRTSQLSGRLLNRPMHAAAAACMV